MKHLITLAAAIAMPLAASAAKPGVDAFFDAMAIAVPPGQQSQFVVGDNLAGYFEGYTQSHVRGAGYTIGNTSVFEGYATLVDGVPRQRAHADEQVLPYGHRVRHAGGAIEEMALLSKQQALAIRLSNPSSASLTVQTLFKAPGAIRRDGDVVLIAPSEGGARLFTAIAADQPFVLEDALALRSAQAARAMTVIVAFGDTAAQASARAQALAKGDAIGAERKALYEALTRSYLATSDLEYNKALNWAKAASRMFVVEEFGTGIWAGLPWFRDNWGRDTFIALPGTLLVSGQFDEAKAVLSNFARYQNLREPRDQEYGRIPNRVSASEKTIYNTVDGTPWMLREAFEYIQYTGDKAFARQMYQLALPYFDGAIANYADRDGLLAHDGADTWMDARIDNQDPWSARGPRAVEIQALWHTALKTGAYLATQAGDIGRARQWNALAAKAQRSFLKLYWDGKLMADRLREDASRDTKVRPNQLMLVSIPFDDFIPPRVQARVTRNAVCGLLYPYGIASLSQDDPYFHPRHENPAYHHKDAAYHQGTIWGWNAGFTVTALNKFGYQDLAWQLSRNLGSQILGLGTLGNMSELLDALPGDDGRPRPSGTYAQSWSVAEYARNGYQDYVGFRPRLLDDTLAFTPAIPAAWSDFHAVLPFGAADSIEVDFRRVGKRQRWTLRLHGAKKRKVAFSILNDDKSRSQLAFDLAPGKAAVLTTGGGKASVDGKPLVLRAHQASYAGEIGELVFRTPRPYRPGDFPMLRSKDVLKGIVERKEYR
ncbi:glycogen debranching protein [Massilia atriviolacea]|uniref:Glycogen debranching protein n=1 Tax=Massilia atriviolacea TaxID=2495579 RepID=A0A430HJM8_9BURK|nr:amylo-alpha-1,6-glucosidase [Massilia atriviolacea]RSZ57728.1 glycogen debranching protein [Massilia atriviolacea]